MRDVSVETVLEYVRTSNVEAIEAAVRQSGYDVDTQDDVSTVHVSHNARDGHLSLSRHDLLLSTGFPSLFHFQI